MSEIRQIQLDGVNYDLVITEDEISATRAEQAAEQATQQAAYASEYAQDAEDAADRAEAIVGGQFVSYGEDQGLTDAYKEQARKNIKATSHNPNLLDNPWWGSEEVVNQRNVSTNFSGYCIDRWKTAGAGSFSLGSTGITITGATQTYLTQVLETKCGDVAGKVFTGTVLLSDGTIYSGTAAFSGTAASTFYNANNLLVYIEPVSYTNPLTQNLRFGVSVNGSATKTIHAVKLELGSFSTLAQDTPPDYGEELTRCIYSTADPTDTYANNGFGRTNPNLLDNPFFTINQRDVAAGVIVNANGFIADRWQATGTVGAQRNSDGTITINNTMYHKLGERGLSGKTVTLSAMYADDTVESTTFIWSGTKTQNMSNLNAVVYADSNQINFSASQKNVKALKLELGSVSTLANDLPPDYGTELAKCQRYFIRVAPTAYTTLWSGVCINASTFAFNITTPVPMRVSSAMTITFTGTLDFVEQTTSGAAIRTVTGLTAYVPVSNSNNIRVLATTASTLGSNNLACIYTYAYTPVIDISCDL